MPNGHIGLLFNGQVPPYGVGDYHTIFQAYFTQHSLRKHIELYPYNTNVVSLASYKGKLVALAWDSVGTHLRMRVSSDSGYNWTSETSLAAATFVSTQVTWNGAGSRPAVIMRTNRVGDTLYVFYLRHSDKHVVYRKTTNADPTTGWTAETDTGFTIPSVGRNFGGASARNQGDTRSYVIVESKTAGTWIIGAESDDGDFHANHAYFQGTLGGTWTRKHNGGMGGGLSGNQGANGGLFLDRNNDLIGWIMSDNGDSVEMNTSTDSGATWSSTSELMDGIATVGLGAGAGVTNPNYIQKEFIWGNQAGGNDGTTPPSRRYIGGLSIVFPRSAFQVVLGEGQNSGNVSDSAVTEVGDRVASIGLDKSTDLDADTFSLTLQNEDGALNVMDAGGILHDFVQPDSKVEIWQWHGVVANAVKTFTGYIDHSREQAEGPKTLTINGRDVNKKLITQEIATNGLSQQVDVQPNDRTPANGVYIDLTLNEVLTDLIVRWGGQVETDLDLAPSSFMFGELIFGDGEKLIDCAKRACDLAGVRFWATEDGVWHTRALSGGPALSSVWTFTADADITTMTPEISDDATKTRVRIIGRKNLGGKYLREVKDVAGRGHPAGIEYDPTTGTIWYLDQDGTLSRLDPTNGYAVLQSQAGVCVYPDGLCLDLDDGNLWVTDFNDPTLGISAFKKINRTTLAVMAGPFACPEDDHCALTDTAVGNNKLYFTTLGVGQLIRVNKTTHVEVDRVTPSLEPTGPYALSGITVDGGGGYFITLLGDSNFYQIGFDGAQVNKIRSAYQDANEIGYDSSGTPGVWVVYQDENRIVKYLLETDPTGAEKATLAEAVDVAMEIRLRGERRYARIVDMAILDIGTAQITADRQLLRLALFNGRVPVGIVGNPGIQKGDRITIKAPSSGISSDWIVVSNRSDQRAQGGSYLSVLVVEPFGTTAAPVLFDAVADAAPVSASSMTWSHTCGGSNRYLTVGILWDNLGANAGAAPTSVTFNGVAMTLLGTVLNGGAHVSMYGLVAPASGAHNVVVTFGAAVNVIHGGSVSLKNVHQSTPHGTVVAVSNKDATVTDAVDADMVVDVIGSDNSMTVDAGQTQRFNRAVTYAFAGSTEVGTAPTLSWTPGTVPRHVAVAFKPAPAS